jgi:DNA polymerase-3 subunit alpha
MQLEGLPRHSSTHAAGVVIGDRPLSQLVPLYRDPRSDMPVTQFDMKYVEGAGLVKFDFLGLKTLSVLQRAVDLLKKRGVEVDLAALPWDDTAVYDLLQRGDTVGVFQLESEGMRRTLAAVKPTNFGDIIALVSLYRPGPMDNIPMFGRSKNGQESIEYPHEAWKAILRNLRHLRLSGTGDAGRADPRGLFAGRRRSAAPRDGQEDQAEMDAQRAALRRGLRRECRQSSRGKANELFDLIDKFAGYGFNKSHAAAYALLAYQTAWLKAHHPAEFYAASMAYDIHLTDKLTVFVDDMRRSMLSILIAPGFMRRRKRSSLSQQARTRHAKAGRAVCSAVRIRPMRKCAFHRMNPGPPPRAWRRRRTRSAFISQPIRSIATLILRRRAARAALAGCALSRPRPIPKAARLR